jgi:DNA-binding winged helix-turn-helix (wHTH) protein
MRGVKAKFNCKLADRNILVPPSLKARFPLATQEKSPQNRVIFAEFEFDCGTRELKKHGQTLRLEPQPAKVLGVLIRSAGEIVTRQELIREVWGSETFVDFDQGLNYAIRRIRAALENGADGPRFLETVPKTGYRFIVPLAQKQPVDPAKIEPTSPPPLLKSPSRPKLNRVTIGTFVLIPIMIACAATIDWNYRHRKPSTQLGSRPTSLAVLPLRNLSADPEQEYFSDGLTDELITDLAKISGIGSSRTRPLSATRNQPRPCHRLRGNLP